MSYSAHAYRDFSAIFADQIEEITEAVLDEDQFEDQILAVEIIARKTADLFEKDNPNGFDRTRFLTDSKVSEN